MNSTTYSGKDPAGNEEITKERLVADFRNLGIRTGDLLNVKISVKSIGRVIGGARTVVDALVEAVGPGGTIISDSFVTAYPLPLSKKNARKISNRWTPSYAGAIANAMISHPEAHRSLHPIQKFVAIGAKAEELMRNHTPDSYAYEVLRVMCETGGRNLKIGTDEKVVGVGTTHVAIGYYLGFKQKSAPVGVNYCNENGETVTFEKNWAGGCGVGFNKFIPLYRAAGAIVGEGKVGFAESKITDMKQTLALEIEKLKSNPPFFLCDNPACESCRLSWDFSDGSRLSVAFHQFKKNPIGFMLGALGKIRQRFLP